MTKSIKENEIQREWVILDAEGKTLGRLVTEIASLLKGKHRPFYTPHVDCGDNVVVINASKVKLSKVANEEAKDYKRHTGYFGGVVSEKFTDLRENNPEKLFKLATRGMLPKTKLGKVMLKKLRVYE
ncbi:MAG: 50S ribosomal protein L13, partial [Campylobacterales bacterium]|nr:50S ribosomal protein L13 [Campylobacterales bacterium]